MTRRFIAAALLGASFATAQLAPPAAPAATTAPKIACDQATHDFGTADNQSTVKHTFKVRNDGTSVLNISQVKPACGCTIANISSKVLQPGEEATIDAALNLKGRRGLQTKTITVHSNDPKTPEYRLTLKGTAASEIGINPTSVYLGQLGVGETVTKTVSITNNGTNDLRILKVTSQNNLVTYRVETNTPGKAYTLHVTNSDTMPIGRINDYLTVTTNNKTSPSERLTVFGNVVAKLSVSPTKLTLDPGAGTGNHTVTVKAGSVRNYQILDVAWPEAGGSLKVVNGGVNGFTITFSGVEPKPELNGTSIVIKTTVAGMEEIEIPVTVKAAP